MNGLKGTAVIALCIGALLVSACGQPAASPPNSTATVGASFTSVQPPSDSTPTRTPSPIGSSEATPSDVAPSPTQDPDLTVTLDVVARVTVDDLRVRPSPDTAGDVVGRLISGDLTLVSAGPVTADGLTWYEVGVEGIRGWVAAGGEDDPWLVGAPDEDAPMLATLRLDTCTIMCNEVVWYADPQDPNGARLVRRTVDTAFPGGRQDGERFLVGAGELLYSMLLSGQLDASRTLEPELLPGQTPAGYAEDINRTFVRRTAEGDLIRVSWRIPVEPQRYEPQPDADALEELARGIDQMFAE